MKLKYYLRGLGIGIAITSVVMGLALGNPKKESMSDDEIRRRAKELGMVEKDEILLDFDVDTKQEEELDSDEKKKGSSELSVTTIPIEMLTPVPTVTPTPTPTATPTPTPKPTVQAPPEIKIRDTQISLDGTTVKDAKALRSELEKRFKDGGTAVLTDDWAEAHVYRDVMLILDELGIDYAVR